MDLTSPPIFGSLIVVAFLILLCLRVPIAVSLTVAALAGILVISGGDFNLALIAFKKIPFTQIASWSLLPIPLFIIMGSFAFAAGITQKAYRTASNWLGWMPGGLGVATMGACAMFAACSGSSVATAGTMGRVALPEMLKYGYDKKLATGTVASGGLLGIMIPPSIVFVIYGIVTETSIARLLLAGVFPGLLTALLFSLTIILMVTRNPKLAPTRVTAATWKARIYSLKDVWGVLLLALVIMGGIYSGTFTPSEASAVGALAALILALAQGRRAWPEIKKAFLDTIATASMIFFLMVGAGLFSFTITMAGVPRWFAETITSLAVPNIVILTLIIGLYFVLGMFVDTISMMLITLPVVFPVILGLGYNPIWFGVLVVKFNELGLITPPVGVNVYVIKGVSPPGISLEDVFRGCIPFLITELVTLIILIAFPIISLWLPSMMHGV